MVKNTRQPKARAVRLPRRFKTVQAGEWVQPSGVRYHMKCCDCGLIHRMEFRLYRNRLQFRAWRVAPASKGKGKKIK